MILKCKRASYGVQPPLTSLIDIVFMLLIFFLLTTNFITDESISIKLPRARASKPQVEKILSVQVDKEGRIFLESRQLDEPTLFKRLKERLADSVKKAVTIRADREVALDRVVRVMDTAKAAGARTLSLSTEKEAP